MDWKGSDHFVQLWVLPDFLNVCAGAALNEEPFNDVFPPSFPQLARPKGGRDELSGRIAFNLLSCSQSSRDSAIGPFNWFRPSGSESLCRNSQFGKNWPFILYLLSCELIIYLVSCESIIGSILPMYICRLGSAQSARIGTFNTALSS
jgi:hypothetical protein